MFTRFVRHCLLQQATGIHASVKNLRSHQGFFRPHLRLSPEPTATTENVNRDASSPDEIESIEIESIRMEVSKLIRERFFGFGQSASFANFWVLACQHMLDTTPIVFHSWVEDGLQPKKVCIVSKDYSHHEGTASKMRRMGFQIIKTLDQIAYGSFQLVMSIAVMDAWAALLGKIFWHKQMSAPRRRTRAATLKLRSLHNIKLDPDELIMILDDGSQLLCSAPPGLVGNKQNQGQFCGVEQTSYALRTYDFRALPFPVINVAGSAVKKFCEYPCVAEVGYQRLQPLLRGEIYPEFLKGPRTIGIIGVGNMGRALANRLLQDGYTVYLYDHDKSFFEHKDKFPQKNAIFSRSLSVAISNSSLILGCSGRNISTPTSDGYPALMHSASTKWLVSFSSADTEFNTILREYQLQIKATRGIGVCNPYDDLVFKNEAGKNLILLGGCYPYNFTREAHSVPAKEILLTRLLLSAAGYQGAYLHKIKHPVLKSGTCIKLDPQVQMICAKFFLQRFPGAHFMKHFSEFDSDEAMLDFIRENSEGEEIPIEHAPDYRPQLKGY